MTLYIVHNKKNSISIEQKNHELQDYDNVVTHSHGHHLYPDLI